MKCDICTERTRKVRLCQWNVLSRQPYTGPCTTQVVLLTTCKQTCVCPHDEEVHARKWKLYAPTQDTA
jgi:hypothetical protein